MLIKNFFKILFLILLLPKNIFAAEHAGHGEDHSQIFHSFKIETDVGSKNSRTFDLDGWVGSDYNRLWLKSEQKTFGKYEKKSEVEALYSRNVEEFWDAQIGMRHDFRSDFSSKPTNYLTIALHGLAPYFFETNAQIFLSDDGDYSARLKQEIDILITQKLIVQPYLEAEIFAQDVDKQEVRSGITNIETGILTRYEITKKFAPYFSIRYATKTFGTANLAKQNGEKTNDFIAGIGLRLKF